MTGLLWDDNTIQARFEAFDQANPQVWDAFVRFAEELLRRGYDHYSSDAVMHRLRWHFNVETTRDGGFKLNDHFTSRYARKLARLDPRFESFFEFRRLKAS